ncbi:MAG: amidohydrolase family protein [Spirochaetales bacterium]|jgi:N-acyl-D-aspartate/D-glutamate deacylase
MYDLIIRNGFVIDGSGAPGSFADVAVRGDKVAKIAPHIDEQAVKTLDAAGAIVVPGLIDPHVHEEWVCFVDGGFEHFLRQGVTTLVNGNCGHSVLPGPRDNFIDYFWGNGLLSTRQKDDYKKRFPEWHDYASYMAAVEKAGTNINLASLIGHGSLRWTVMKGAHDRPPTPAEAAEIERHLRLAMEQGAMGVSFGLDYVPSRYAKLDELVSVTKIVAEYDGVAAAHLRHALGIKEATEEFVNVGRLSGAKIQVSHLKSTCPEAFEVARKAVDEEGLRVRVDTIPRSTGHCTSKSRLILFIMALSDELFAGGAEGVKKALSTPEGRAVVKKDAYIFAGDKADLFVVRSEDPKLEAKSVKAIAAERGVDPDECMLDLLGDDLDYTFWLGGPSRKDFPATGHVATIIANPYVSVGTDEIMGDPEYPFDWYELQRRGGFPIFFRMYRAAGVATEEIIRRNTTMVAEHFGLSGRGRLAEGFFADIAVIDAEAYDFPPATMESYKNPLATASGVRHVVVNGKLALESGRLLATRSGRTIKRGQ